jgi:hypothetical protein
VKKVPWHEVLRVAFSIQQYEPFYNDCLKISLYYITIWLIFKHNHPIDKTFFNVYALTMNFIKLNISLELQAFSLNPHVTTSDYFNYLL